jgi:hypothetical protein
MKFTRALSLTAFLLLLGFVLIDLVTVECIRAEDTCYRRQCTKSCYDVITPCDSILVTGHKEMCVEKRHFWEEPANNP